MMGDWIMQHFAPDGYGGVIVYEEDSGWLSCDPNWLAGTLGSTVPPTYAALSALPIASQGWQKIFDQWKERGIVS